MKIFDNFKKRHQEAKETELMLQAKRRISSKSFKENLYISFDDTPIILIEENISPKEIVKKIKVLRENYVHAKMSDDLERVTSVVF